MGNRVKFDSPVGACEVEWTDYGVCRFRLPDLSARGSIRAPRNWDSPAEAPTEITLLIDAVRSLLSGEPSDLSSTRLDLRNVSDFNKRVYTEALRIPRGRTMSYGKLATAIGANGAAQAVGRALGENPIPLIIPCHRILAADGAMHGFSAPGGTASKRRLLEIEGAIEPEPPTLFDFANL